MAVFLCSCAPLSLCTFVYVRASICVVCLCASVHVYVIALSARVLIIFSCSSYGRSWFLYLATSETTIASEIDAQSTSNKLRKKQRQGQNRQNNQ